MTAINNVTSALEQQAVSITIDIKQTSLASLLSYQAQLNNIHINADVNISSNVEKNIFACCERDGKIFRPQPKYSTLSHRVLIKCPRCARQYHYRIDKDNFYCDRELTLFFSEDLK